MSHIGRHKLLEGCIFHPLLFIIYMNNITFASKTIVDGSTLNNTKVY